MTTPKTTTPRRARLPRPGTPDILNSEPAMSIPIAIAVVLGLLNDLTGITIPEETIERTILPGALLVSGWLTRRYVYNLRSAQALADKVPKGYIRDPNYVEADEDDEG